MSLNMETAGLSGAALSTLPWVPISIGGRELLAKAWFGENEYRILLSDLNNVWEEEMSVDRIKRRAQDLNKRLRATPEAFFMRLQSLIKPFLSGQSNKQSSASFAVEDQGSYLSVRLNSEIEGLPFYWEFHCTPASVKLVSQHLVRPLLAMTRVLQRQVGELSALLVKKDAEIQDYQENGAQLSRARLQTEPFEEESYQENFITQCLPKMDRLQDNMEFDAELQNLYVVVNTVRTSQKRKHSDEPSTADTNSISTVPEHATSDQDQSSHMTSERINASACLPASSQNEVQNQAVNQNADRNESVQHVAADRPATRTKKKKAVGLFR